MLLSTELQTGLINSAAALREASLSLPISIQLMNHHEKNKHQKIMVKKVTAGQFEESLPVVTTL